MLESVMVSKAVHNILPSCPILDTTKIVEKIVASYETNDFKFNPKVIVLRVAAAHIRHHHTQYDTVIRELSREGITDKAVARSRVNGQVNEILCSWRKKEEKADLSDWFNYKRHFTGKFVK